MARLDIKVLVMICECGSNINIDGYGVQAWLSVGYSVCLFDYIKCLFLIQSLY